MPAKDQHLYRHQERLHPENDGVDHAHGIDHMQKQRFTEAEIAGRRALHDCLLGV